MYNEMTTHQPPNPRDSTTEDVAGASKSGSRSAKEVWINEAQSVPSVWRPWVEVQHLALVPHAGKVTHPGWPARQQRRPRGDAGARPFLRSHPELIDPVYCTHLSYGADVDQLLPLD